MLLKFTLKCAKMRLSAELRPDPLRAYNALPIVHLWHKGRDKNSREDGGGEKTGTERSKILCYANLAYNQKTSPVFNVRRTLPLGPLGSSSGAPGGDQQTLLAYLNSYIGCTLSGASSSRSPALPTKPYLLPRLPPLFIPETLHPISYLAFV